MELVLYRIRHKAMTRVCLLQSNPSAQPIIDARVGTFGKNMHAVRSGLAALVVVGFFNLHGHVRVAAAWSPIASPIIPGITRPVKIAPSQHCRPLVEQSH